jgi:glycosyltransferase involved in cell wall biosynthesis
MAPSASVVVCTRDRAALLAETLRRLCAQSVPAGLDWEILVVDNASSDDTADVVKRAAEQSPVPLRYVQEPETGLAIARNRGWREARGEIVAYVDDDTLVDRLWLAEALGPYAAERVAGVGGRLLPLVDPVIRDGFDPGWLEVYTFDRGPEHDVDVVSGANMSFRRAVLERIGGFEVQLGRIGGCLLGGDEYDVCRKIRREPGRLRIVYNPRMLVHHRLPVAPFSDALLVKRSHCGGISNALLDRKERPLRRGYELLLRNAKLALWAARALRRRLSGRSRSLQEQARLQEFAGYYKERLLGSRVACRGCPMFPQRLPRVEAAEALAARERG